MGTAAGVLVGVVLYLLQQREQNIINVEYRIPRRPTEQPKRKAAAPRTTREKDRLETIHGIGAVYARRLNDAGVYTYAQLAALAPERAQEITRARGASADPKAWIREAGKLNRAKAG